MTTWRSLALIAVAAGVGASVVAVTSGAAPPSSTTSIDCYDGFTGEPIPEGVRLSCVIPATVPTTTLATTQPATTAPVTTAPPTTVPATTVPPTEPTTTTTTTIAATTTTLPSGAAFTETFDGNVGLERFDTEIHHRDAGTPFHDYAATWPGDHDMACGGADTSRTVHASSDAESIYPCRDHVMTSMGDIDGYSVMAFSPQQTFTDLSRICWDQNVTWSTLNTRQWTEVVVRPASEIPAGRLAHVNPRFEDVDATALLHGPTTVGVLFQGPAGLGAAVGHAERWYDDYYHNDPDGNVSKAIRRQHCLTENANGTITVSVDQGWRIWSRSFAGQFPTDARVIFENHSYTPNKTEGGPPTTSYTWHWDNILIEAG